LNIPPWSYSSLTAFENCPRRYYLTRVSKQVAEPGTEATKWGTEVHTALENRVKDGTPVPESMQKWQPLCDRIQSYGGEVFTERQYALTADFRPTEWRSPDAWVRGIVDAGVLLGNRAVLIDWKSGRPKADSDQLKLFAAFVFHTEPKIDKVSTAFVWLVHNKITKEKFTRADVSNIWQGFLPRVRRLEIAYENDKWEARPSGLCRAWCPVGKALCQFCGK
jgi:hypothetical protein